jgi:glutaredoxin 3
MSATPRVRLYTLPGCNACTQARGLLRRRGVDFEEVVGARDAAFRRELLARTGRATLPQLVVDDQVIGGAADLLALDRRGVLLAVLRGEPFPLARVGRRLSPIRLLRSIFSIRPRTPWVYAAELVDRDGRVLEHCAAGSAEEAEHLVELLRREYRYADTVSCEGRRCRL